MSITCHKINSCVKILYLFFMTIKILYLTLIIIQIYLSYSQIIIIILCHCIPYFHMEYQCFTSHGRSQRIKSRFWYARMCFCLRSQHSHNRSVKLMVFNRSSKWQLIPQILLSTSSNGHRIAILPITVGIHPHYSPYDCLEPFVN